MKTEQCGIKAKSSRPIEETERNLREALAGEGFGVLTEIDVAATLHEKLGVERDPNSILGARNPQLANQALDAEIDVGLLLPCNVVLYRDGDDTVVAALDPATMVDLTNNPELEPIATEARVRLKKVINSMAEFSE